MGADRFRTSVFLIVFLFGALQLAYALRVPLVMDEFDGAYESYRLRHETPYRDYIPYKTVLGYYLKLPATFFAGTVWGRLMALKLELILLNMVMLGAVAFYCARFLRPLAVIAALAILAASTPMLERSSEIRVDMLTAWAGLWSLLVLVRRRFALAGLLCAVSFAISQKAALYVIASNAVLIASIVIRSDRRASIRAFLLFSASAAGGLLAYLAFWSAAGDAATVVRSTFLSASQTAVSAVYDIQWRFWSQVLVRNLPMFALVAAALWFCLRLRSGPLGWERGAIGVYAAVLLAQAALYTQPWPYFFVIVFPTLFVLLAAWFDVAEPSPRPVLRACVALAILYPLHRPMVMLGRDHAYQRYNVALASGLLAPSDPYLAANDIIHDREQRPARLARLDAVELRRLTEEPPAVHSRLMAELDRHPPKLVIATYRIYNLPQHFLDYIDRHYARLSGSVRLYAPLVLPAQQVALVRFPGRYRVEVQSGQAARIDGVLQSSGTLIDLRAGPHAIATPAPLRLRLLPPDVEQLVDPRYVVEQIFYRQAYD